MSTILTPLEVVDAVGDCEGAHIRTHRIEQLVNGDVVRVHSALEFRLFLVFPFAVQQCEAGGDLLITQRTIGQRRQRWELGVITAMLFASALGI